MLIYYKCSQIFLFGIVLLSDPLNDVGLCFINAQSIGQKQNRKSLEIVIEELAENGSSPPGNRAQNSSDRGHESEPPKPVGQIEGGLGTRVMTAQNCVTQDEISKSGCMASN